MRGVRGGGGGGGGSAGNNHAYGKQVETPPRGSAKATCHRVVDCLSDLHFTSTGVMDTLWKGELQRLIEHFGGTWHHAWSNKVTHLLHGWDGGQYDGARWKQMVPFEGKAGARNAAQKLTAARAKGVPIFWLEYELFALIKERSKGGVAAAAAANLFGHAPAALPPPPVAPPPAPAATSRLWRARCSGPTRPSWGTARATSLQRSACPLLGRATCCRRSRPRRCSCAMGCTGCWSDQATATRAAKSWRRRSRW